MMQRFFFMLMFLPALAFSDVPKGEKLVQRLWKDKKEGHIRKIKSYTSKEFQSIHFFGAYNRFQELDLIKNIHLVSYELSDIKVTQGENIIIVAYMAKVTETILDQAITSKNPRISVWKKYGGEWKWVAHANLANPLSM